MENQNLNILDEINKGATMGMNAISFVSDKANDSRFAYLFIRKVAEENGLTLPFTYVGKGKLSNPRKSSGENGTYLFDIYMENELPEYLQYDFGLSEIRHKFYKPRL